VYLKIPELSSIESHPFSVASAPQDPHLSVHIRCVGDWTQKLQQHLQKVVDQTQNSSEPIEDGRDDCGLQFRLDGPLGAPAQSFVRYEHLMLVSAGLGVTPFLSVLRHLLHKWRQQDAFATLLSSEDFGRVLHTRRVDFVWVARTWDYVDWVLEMLLEFHDVLPASKSRVFVHFYLTGATEAILSEFVSKSTRFSSISHTFRVMCGRPQWKRLFRMVMEKKVPQGPSHPQVSPDEAQTETVVDELGLFICGPDIMCQQVKTSAAEFTEETRKAPPRLRVFAEIF